MEFLDKLLAIFNQLIDLVFSTPKLVAVIVIIIFIAIIFKIGFMMGNKKKPPEFKVKMKDSYSLEELSDISLKK